jgi:hypothetical protein
MSVKYLLANTLLSVILAGTGQAATTNWVAVNDHMRGTGTAANVNTWSVAAVGTIGGPLTNRSGTIPTNGTAGVGVSIVTVGTLVGTNAVSGTPSNGTPAYTLWSGLVEWTNSALYFGPGPLYNSSVSYTFTNLNPAKRYSFRGTAARGSYLGRWTLVTIAGAGKSVPAHLQGVGSPGVVTNGWIPYGTNLMPSQQAALGFGQNTNSGDVVGWDGIVAAEGSFSIICSNWRAFQTIYPLAGGGQGTLDNQYSYAFSALTLTETEPMLLGVELASPADQQNFVSGTVVSATAAVTNGIPPFTVRFYTNGVSAGDLVGEADQRFFSQDFAGLVPGTNTLYAEVTDSDSPVATTNGTSRTFYVADPMAVALLAPVNGGTYDSASSLLATCTVAGGRAPYAVQFYSNDVALGTAAFDGTAYWADLGMFGIASGYQIRAVVTDASQWVSNSAVATITVASSSLTVVLNSPINGGGYGAGMSVPINLSVGGASVITNVTIYTNGAAFATLDPGGTVAVLETNLADVFAGTYSIYAMAVDTASTTSYSGTNTITVTNVNMVAAFTSPLGQATNNLRGQDFTLAVEAGGGSGISSVEFFTNGVSCGLDTAAPFATNVAFGASGHPAVTATVTDTHGLTTNIGPFSLNVTNPTLVLTLNWPANHGLSGLGQSVSATATVAGGGSPYAVTFYVSVAGGGYGAVAAAGSYPDYSAELGVLPAGTYQVYAQVTDVDTSANSATNTFIVSPSVWVAFNDHYRGAGSSTNDSFWNVFGTAGNAPGNSGFLKNIANGTNLPVSLTITNRGVTGATTMGAPASNTPAYNLFNGYVDFGSGGTGTNHAVFLYPTSVLAHVFTGLNPGQRYKLQGTAVRGTPTGTNRWTVCRLEGAAAFRHAHSSTNVWTAATPGSGLAANEAAFNSGVNNLLGDYVGWEEIVPDSSGVIVLYSRMFTNVPGWTTTSPGFGLVALRLEEVAGTTIGLVSQPQGAVVCPGEPFNLSVAVAGAQPWSIQWQKDGVNITDATNQNYAINTFLAGHAGVYAVIVSNTSSVVLSAAANVALNTNQPVIVTDPQNQIFALGNPVALTVGLATDFSPAPSFRWYKNSTSNNVTGTLIPGATARQYLIPSASAGDAAYYYVVAQSCAWSATSQVARLEVQAVSLALTSPQNASSFESGTTVGATALVANGNAPYQVTFYTNGNGTGFAEAQTVSTIGMVGSASLGSLVDGIYSIYARVVDNVGGTAYTATNGFTVGAGRFRLVWQDSPSPASPYLTWDTAAHTLQDAVDAAADGDTVLVTNGVYASGGKAVSGTMTNRVAVDKVLSLRSVNGPEVTIIQGWQLPGTTNGDGAIRCVYLTNGAVLSGFTLTNGATLTSGDYARELCGGGLWAESSQALASNCVFRGNAAEKDGGGAFGGKVSHCTFTGNSAYYGGGAASGWLDNCTLAGNLAAGPDGGAGGGVYSCPLVTGCILTSNLAFYGGGACYGRLDHCILAGNLAAAAGGGVSGGTLSNCTLTGNSAAYGGGADYASLDNCALMSNSASAYGGGADGGTLRNCSLVGNTAADRGGGAYAGTLHNCSLAGNSATNSGGGVYGGNLSNCVVFYNAAITSPNIQAPVTINYSCTTPMPANGVGNITNEPAFVDLAGGNLRLQSNSPCINAGHNASAAGPVDLDGNPRIANGTVDLGAYEYQGAGSIVSYAWLQQYGLATDGSADLADPDHDGQNNWQEWVAGTDPTSPASAFRVDSITPGPPVGVTFWGLPDRLYTLLVATNLANPVWTPVAGQADVAGTGAPLTLTDASPADCRFYRVKVARP